MKSRRNKVGGSAFKYSRRRLRWAFLLLSILLALVLAKPAAPGKILLLTGPEDSSFHTYGLRYADFLRKHGVEAEVVITEGSRDSLKRLQRSGDPAVAFSHSGVGSSMGALVNSENLVSLAGVAFEPLWCFADENLRIDDLADIEGKKLVVAVAGTSSEEVSTLILEATNLADNVTLVQARPRPWHSRKEGYDLIFAIGPPDLEFIDFLLKEPHLKPVSFSRADAYTWNFPYLGRVVVPMGAIDLAKNTPGEDLTLLSTVVQLASRDDLHPAMVELLLDGARSIHRTPTHFGKQGKFPGTDHLSLPLDPAAEHYFDHGRSTLRKLLPYRLATIVDRFLTAFAAIAGVAVAILSILPRLIVLPLKIRLNQALKKVAKIEMESASGGDPEDMVARLDEIDAETINYRVPLSQLETYLNYRQLLFDSRERFREREE